MKRYRVLYKFTFINSSFMIIPNQKNGIIDVLALNHEMAKDMAECALKTFNEEITYDVRVAMIIPNI